MTLDDALLIARRIMDRTEIDQAQHLEAIAAEIQAGVVLWLSRQMSDTARFTRKQMFHDAVQRVSLMSDQEVMKQTEILRSKQRH